MQSYECFYILFDLIGLLFVDLIIRYIVYFDRIEIDNLISA